MMMVFDFLLLFWCGLLFFLINIYWIVFEFGFFIGVMDLKFINFIVFFFGVSFGLLEELGI